MAALLTWGGGALGPCLQPYTADGITMTPSAHYRTLQTRGPSSLRFSRPLGDTTLWEEIQDALHLDISTDNFLKSPEHMNWPRILAAHGNVQVNFLLLVSSFRAWDYLNNLLGGWGSGKHSWMSATGKILKIQEYMTTVRMYLTKRQ